MTIKGKRDFPYPGGLWFLFAKNGNRTMAALAGSSERWGYILNRHRTTFPVITARQVA